MARQSNAGLAGEAALFAAPSDPALCHSKYHRGLTPAPSFDIVSRRVLPCRANQILGIIGRLPIATNDQPRRMSAAEAGDPRVSSGNRLRRIRPGRGRVHRSASRKDVCPSRGCCRSNRCRPVCSACPTRTRMPGPISTTTAISIWRCRSAAAKCVCTETTTARWSASAGTWGCHRPAAAATSCAA